MLKIKTEINKEARKTKISMLIFIWSALLFFINLQYNFLNEFDTFLFWLSILFIFGTITYQIFFLKNNTFVLFEILIAYLLLHLVFQVGYYGLRGSDSYEDYAFLKTILNDNNFNLGIGAEGWPMMHIFSSALTMITKVNSLLIAKFLPSFISSIIVFPIYLLSYSIYKDRKIALFSCLVFGTIPQFMNFEALFVRETFGIFSMVLFFYILYISKQKNDYRFAALSVILIPVITFAHHFTSFIVIMVMGLYIIVSKAVPFFYHNFAKLKLKLTGIIDIKIIFFALFITVITYLIFLPIGDLNTFLLNFFTDVTGQSDPVTYSETIKLGTPIVTLRGRVVFYGFLFFHFLFSLLLLIKVIVRRNHEKIEDVTFSMVLFFCLAYGFMALTILGSMKLLFPDRILTFGWIFGMLPLVAFIMKFKNKILKRSLSLILIFFIIFNIYNIAPEFYTGDMASIGNVPSEREYLIAERVDFPTRYYGYSTMVNVVYDVQEIPSKLQAWSIGNIKINNFRKSGTIAVINEAYYLNNLENLKKKSIDQYNRSIEILSYEYHPDVAKIYDLGAIYVLRGSWMG